MEVFIKCISLALLAVSLYPIIAQKEKAFAVAFLLLVCGFFLVGAIQYLQPVVLLLERLQVQSALAPEVFSVLLKVTGLALVSEIAMLVCADSGNASLGKAIGLLTCAAVLSMSIPLMEDLLELVTGILELP